MKNKRFTWLVVLAFCILSVLAVQAWGESPRDVVVNYAKMIQEYPWHTNGYILLYNRGVSVNDDGTLEWLAPDTMPVVATGDVLGIPYTLSTCGGYDNGTEDSFSVYSERSNAEKLKISGKYTYDGGSRISMYHGMSCSTFVTDCIRQGFKGYDDSLNTYPTVIFGDYNMDNGESGPWRYKKHADGTYYIEEWGVGNYSNLQKGDYLRNSYHVMLVIDNNGKDELEVIDQTPRNWDFQECTNPRYENVSFQNVPGRYYAKIVCMQCDACKKYTLGTERRTYSYSSLSSKSYRAKHVNYPNDIPPTIPDSWIKIDAAHFPDSLFREFVSYYDTNHDGYFSNAEIEAVTDFGWHGGPHPDNVDPNAWSGWEPKGIINDDTTGGQKWAGIESIEGIKIFKNLKTLYVYKCNIKNIDVSGMTNLVDLRCYEQKGYCLNSLNIEGCTSLKYLHINNNSLTSLNLSGCPNLEDIQAHINNFSKLSICNLSKLKTLSLNMCDKLTELNCYNNALEKLAIMSCSNLKVLSCSNNNLSTISLTGSKALEEINVSGNKLTMFSAALFPKLKALYCNSNSLTTLYVKNCTTLETVYCQNNNLTSISDLATCSNLTTLWRDSSVNLVGVSKPTITTSSLPNATVGTAYRANINASGTGIIKYSLTSLAKTLGFLLNGKNPLMGDDTTGLINGTPNAARDSVTLTVSAENFVGSTSKSFNIQISPQNTPPTITTESLPQAIAGTAYESLFNGFTATGDTPITWARYDGTLPDGLSLSSSGKITGTPKRVDNGLYTGDVYNIKVTASNSKGSSEPAEFDLTLWTPPEITTSNSLKQGYVGEKYSVNFDATGSSYCMAWSIESGALPDGIGLDKSTVGGNLLGSRQLTITGTPTRAGTYKFTLGVATGRNVAVGLTPRTYEHTAKEFTIEIKNRDLAINATNFPDSVFREYISTNVDSNKDGALSDSEIKSRTSLYLGKSSGTNESSKIGSLKGIEYFTALTYLDCSYNKLTTVDLSKNTALKTLYCYNNQLKALDLSKNTELQTLRCANNQLASLALDKNVNLNYVDCQGNKITALDVSKTKTTKLYCDMAVTKITVPSGYVAIDTVNFPDAIFRDYVVNSKNGSNFVFSASNGGGITSLYLGKSSGTNESAKIATLKGIEYFTALTYLDCSYNKLTTVDLTKNAALKTLYCYNNQLKALDLSKNTELQTLRCANNQLASLALDKNVNLNYVDCQGNKITALDVSKTKTTKLYCDMAVTKITVPSGYVAIDTVNFPDAIFRDYVVNSKNGSNFVFSASNGGGITSLYLGKSSGTNESAKIATLKGIEYFTALTYLDCSYNKLTTVDLTKNAALKTLYCYNNQLQTLDLSKNAELQTLRCANNQLASLALDKNVNLNYVDCQGNKITALDVSKTKTTKLYCDMAVTKITVPSGYVAIDAVNFPDAIFRAYVVSRNSDNFIFNASNGGGITSLYLGNNSGTSESAKISSLKGVEYLTALTYLDCQYNKLTTLDLSKNKALKTLYCNNNQLGTLDLSQNTELGSVNCNNNQLATLTLGNNSALQNLNCANNPSLKTLDIKGCPSLSDSKIISTGNEALEIVTPNGTITPNAPTVEIKPAFKEYSLYLDGQIGVNFYLYLPDGVDWSNEKLYYMEFDIKEGTSNSKYQAYNPDFKKTIKGVVCYGFRCYINSAQLAEKITATFHYNGKTISIKRSVNDYLTQVMEAYKNQPAVYNLMKAIMDYGHYAQEMLAETNGWEIGVKYAAMPCANTYTNADIEAVKTASSAYAFKRVSNNASIKSLQATLLLDSDTVFNVYFQSNNFNGTVLARVDNQGAYPPPIQSSGRYRGCYLVEILNIPAHKLGEMHTVKIEANGVTELNVSALTWANLVLKNSAFSDKTKKAATALYKYYIAAVAYNNSKK